MSDRSHALVPKGFTVFDQPEVDFIILADRAEAIKGKLYMMGGVWDQIGVVDFSKPVAFSIALGILIPWNATNIDHTLRVHLLDEDGTQLFGIDGGFKAGRPPQLPQGGSQHDVLAITVSALLPKPGAYTVEATINGTTRRVTSFYAFDAPHPPQAPA
jgi:uncharacterized protein DUF6941